MLRFSCLMAAAICILAACRRTGSESSSREDHFSATDSVYPGDPHEVLYSLYLPTDISLILEETGTGFEPEYMLPLEMVPLYETPGRQALLLGALGVDLSYCKLFQRIEESARCYTHIELLAGKLGLPESLFEKSASDLERYIDQPDSITSLIEEVYSEVDYFFKTNDQEELASLSLLGGWLEAMYIGVQIYQEDENIEMGDRILQQKFALNSLTGVLGNHQESLMVRRYMHPLKKMKQVYESVDIRYGPEGFRMDQDERLIHASVSQIDCPPEVMDTICRMVIRTREELIK